MTDNESGSFTSVVEDLDNKQKGKKLSTLQFLIRAITIGVPVIAAIPTAYTFIMAWWMDVSPWEVHYRLSQYEIYQRNTDCPRVFETFETQGGTEVKVRPCPKTGDVEIDVKFADKPTTITWVPSEQNTATATVELFKTLIGQAHAAEPNATIGKPIRLAQNLSTETIVCEAEKSGGILVRITKKGNTCVRENISLFKGTSEGSEEVPCDTKCTD